MSKKETRNSGYEHMGPKDPYLIFAVLEAKRKTDFSK